MCANAAMMMQVRPRDSAGPLPNVLDWMPWNHTMGGNAAFHPVLVDGGTLYIDDGRPMPGQIEETLRNLREISPTYYANVPAGYAALAAAMEKDDALCRSFFRNLSVMAYGGARLPDDLYDRMQALAVKTTGERIVFYTGWGSTETAPTATGTYWDTERVGLIGLPFPGVELKMVPCGSKYELRLRGVNVTPGYFGRDDLTKAAFDEEGFYCIGDAGVFVDERDPAAGHHLRRPRRRGFQAYDRHLRACRLAAYRCDRRGNTGGAGCAGGRTGSSVHRPPGLAQSSRLPADRW
jgi:feruloyl-CoA synthase